MKNLILGIGLAGSLVACTKSGTDSIIVALKDEACACQDKACGDAVSKKLDDAMVQFDKDFQKNPKDPTAAAALAAMLEAGECLSKLN